MCRVVPGAEFDQDPASLRPEELKAPPLPDNDGELVSDVLGAFDDNEGHFQAVLARNGVGGGSTR